MTNPITDIVNSGPLLMQGAAKTVEIWLGALSISLTIGTLWGIFRSRRLTLYGLTNVLDGITFLLRGIPFYVQLLIAYFVLPDLIGINISASTTAIFSLGLCSAAYVSQIVRAGINTIPRGQWEAAMVLGYTTFDTIRYIIIPQTIRAVLPALTGECDQLLKTTSVISTIGVLELTNAAKNIIAREMNPLTMYLTIAMIYLIMSSILTTVSGSIEKRLCS